MKKKESKLLRKSINKFAEARFFVYFRKTKYTILHYEMSRLVMRLPAWVLTVWSYAPPLQTVALPHQ